MERLWILIGIVTGRAEKMTSEEKEKRNDSGNPSGVTHTKESREAGLERLRKLRESLK